MNRFYKPVPILAYCTALVLSCCTVFIACGKKDGPPPPPTTYGKEEGSMLLETVSEENDSSYKQTYYYNTDSTIAKLTDSIWGNAASSRRSPARNVEYQRDLQMQLQKVLTVDLLNGQSSEVEFVKKPGHYLTYKVKPDITNTTIEHWLGVDNKGRVIADTLVDQFNIIREYRVCTYDANDNMVMLDGYYANANRTGFDHMYTNTYTYDQQKNPFYNFKDKLHPAYSVITYYPAHSKNNIATYTIRSTIYGIAFEDEYTYTYNKQGFPVTKTSKTGAGGKIIYRYK